ncbi:MAG: glycosyltransferase family 4 protein [Candidatus Cloacimonetes bacterium]|nr:glycosyltransferase family 4 protein [Candidatus Cloacimonadota bacterium]
MNILYISSKKRWGGVVSWMIKTASGLEKKGHKVWILSHPDSKLNKNLPGNIRIISKKLGADYNPLMIVYLIYFIKNNKIELLVTNIEKEISIGGFAAKICGIPNIRRVGNDNDFFDRFKTKFNHNFYVTHSIVPCDAIKDKLKQQAEWLNMEEFTTIYNGRNPHCFIEEETIKRKKEIGLRKEDKIIGITSQLTNIKCIDQLIKAFANISKKNPEWKLVITGEGPERKNLEKLTSEINLNNTIFAGFTAKPILTASIYDIAVLTSEIEGFPNSIVEYFAAGKPVIATDVGGVNEIITDNFNGFLIPSGEIDLLSKKLEILMNDEKLRKKFSANALITLNKKFTEDIMIEKLEKLYGNLIRHA